MFVYNLEVVLFLSATECEAQHARKNTIGHNNKELILRNVGLHSLIAVYYFLCITCTLFVLFVLNADLVYFNILAQKTLFAIFPYVRFRLN